MHAGAVKGVASTAGAGGPRALLVRGRRLPPHGEDLAVHADVAAHRVVVRVGDLREGLVEQATGGAEMRGIAGRAPEAESQGRAVAALAARGVVDDFGERRLRGLDGGAVRAGQTREQRESPRCLRAAGLCARERRGLLEGLARAVEVARPQPQVSEVGERVGDAVRVTDRAAQRERLLDPRRRGVGVALGVGRGAEAEEGEALRVAGADLPAQRESGLERGAAAARVAIRSSSAVEG